MTDLRPAFPPEFAAFAGTVISSHPDAAPLPDLLRPAALHGIVTRYGQAFPGGDRRAVLSLWSQYYLLALLPAVAASVLVAPDDLPVALETTRLVLAEDGRPSCFCLNRAGAAASPCPAVRLTCLLRTHLEPFAARLQDAGLPPVVLWANAGHVLAWAVRIILAAPDRRAVLADSLQCAIWLDGAPNPLAKGYGAALREGRRSACCLRFRLPGLARCAGCPRAS